MALKVPFFNASESPQRAERFVREARSAAVLQHPNICTVFDAGQIEGRPFITMAYIAGKPLEDEIDPDVPMPQIRAAEVVRKIAVALEHAHTKGIVHRDLKPANVMMAAGGEPVVMDFGLAKRVVDVDPNEAKLTRDGGLLGTPSYMAPEQCKGEVSAIGPATDVYALGVMLFELLTGKTPYTGALSVVIGRILTAPAPTVKEFRIDVHSRLDAICRKAMAKEPADRYASMAEFAEALGKYLKAAAASAQSLPTNPVVALVKVPSPVVGRSPFDDANKLSPPPLVKGKGGPVVIGPLPWKKWPILAGGAACFLMAGLVVLLAAMMFKVKTPDGILVVQVNEPNAEVFVDGDRMTVSWNDGGTKAEIHVKPGARKVEVKKDGFSVDRKELNFKDGDTEVSTARLLPDEPRLAKADALPPEKPALIPELSKMTVVFRDGFTKPNPGWPVDNIETRYLADRYSIRTGQWTKRWFFFPVPPFTDGAVEVVGRILGPPSNGWGIAIAKRQNNENRGFQVALNSEGSVAIGPWVYDDNHARGPNVAPLKSPAVQPGEQWNTLLVVVRRQTVAVYVNGTAVGDPVTVEGDFQPGLLILQTFGGEKDGEIEIRRCTVWTYPTASP